MATLKKNSLSAYVGGGIGIIGSVNGFIHENYIFSGTVLALSAAFLIAARNSTNINKKAFVITAALATGSIYGLEQKFNISIK